MCLKGQWGLVVCVVVVGCFCFGFVLSMAGLEELWSQFSLTKDEEGGVEVAHQDEVVIHCLAGKFFTKHVLNVDVVVRTFKPLWKPIGELKIRDIEEGVLLFEFEDALNLERVLEYEPWSYDKSLVVFKKTNDIESIPFLEFDCVTFWVQIHNVPKKSLNHETGEAIGKNDWFSDLGGRYRG